ncbi:glycosyltransferase family 2 protein [Methanogenium cariaci]|uniref:glycosyltransferase n=1 Tax=Methanogenium cariaci TaxID=2197 RepID=UPI0007855467|nr:glycosyltransferase [Methanogenium cariaci]
MISIIIPALNEEETILNCLRSLTAQSIPRKEYEIIVVDGGGSSDNTRAIAETLADQVISQKRAGIGGARGDGAGGAAHGTILVFTDADTRYPHRLAGDHPGETHDGQV